MKRIYYTLMVLFAFIDCKGQSINLFEKLVHEIKSDNISVEYNEFKEDNVFIKYPQLRDEKLRKFFSHSVNKDKKENYCDKEGKVFISYDVKYLTPNMVSVVKTTKIQFCPHFADLHNETSINILINNSEELVTFNLSKKAISKLREGLEDEGDCMYKTKNGYVKYDFYIENSFFKVNIWLDKICNYTIEVPIDKELITFDW